MKMCCADLVRRLRLPLLAAVILATQGISAQQQQGPVMSRPSLGEEAQALAILAYWTPERMRAAVPKPFPPAVARGTEVSVNVPVAFGPGEGPGYAPGWRVGGGAQPTASAKVQIGRDDPQALAGFEQVQTTPPFVPPATPTDFVNYAPFQRFTWQQSNNLVYPLSTVGKLFFTQRGVNFVCSASVIQRSALATAGHCVHDGTNSSLGFSTNVLFCPSLNPSGSPRGCWPGIRLVTSRQWFASANIDRDYGCIVTRTFGTTINNRIGNVTGWLGRSWNFPSRQSTFALGYPAGPPFTGNRLVAVVSTEWYQLNRNTSEAQLSKYMGNDLTGGSSGGPWWLSHTHANVEFADTDGSGITDPGQGGTPLLNGVNSHKRCTAAGCPAGTVFTQEMGSPQFRSTTADINESEDVFAVCFANGGTS